MGGALLAHKQPIDGMNDQADAPAHGGGRVPQQRFSRERGLTGLNRQFQSCPAPISFGQHRPSPSAFASASVILLQFVCWIINHFAVF
jgi:hypothetical protein